MPLVLRIRLLGAVGAMAGSDELVLGGRRPRAVLAMLALAAPRACSAHQLVDGLWGDDPPPSARNAVQVNVTGLRKALQPHEVAVERVGDGYALRGPLSVDAASFERLVSAGRTALRAGEVSDCVQSLSDALVLWEGSPLGGLGDAPFVEESRRSLEGVRISALVDLGEAQLRAGDPSAAVRTMEGLLLDHPFDERGWIGLATAHYWTGQQDQALATCRRARDVLLDELGIDPTPALVAVERQILHHELPDRSTPPGPTEAEASAVPLPALPPHLVGREQLTREVAALIGSGIRLVSLVGIGGIGKTTLGLAVAHGVAGAVFCSLETEVEVASAWGRICRSLGSDPEDDSVAAIGAAFPSGVLMLDNVEQVAGIGPALDDLLRRVPGLTVLVTTRRPTRARLEHAVQVPPLNQDSAVEMFREHAERVRPGIGRAADQDVVPRLCAVLDGIPLALELAAGRIRTLTPRQLLARIETRRTSVLEGSEAVSVPERQDSLRGVLEEAYEALTQSARRLFELLGSIDGSVSLELLEATAAGWVDDAVDALDELVGCGLVSLDLDGRVRMRGPVREFAHAKGPRADLDGRLRREVVRQVRDAAPRLFGAETGVTLARLRRDDDSIAAAITRAVDSGDQVSAAVLAHGLNRYWLLTGRLNEGRMLIERAAAIPGHTQADAARLALLAGTYASYVDDPDTESRLAEALASAETADLPVDRLIVNAWCCLAAHAAHHKDFATADSAARAAASLAAMTKDPALVALARDVDGHVAAYMKDHDRALTAKLSGLADARAAGDDYDVINLLTDISDELLSLGRIDEALAYADEAFDLTGAFDPGPLLSSVLLLRGVVLAVADRVPAARGNLLAALRLIQDRRPDPLATADALYALAACAVHDLADVDACRFYGAADALYGDQAVNPDDRLATPLLEVRDRLRERLGPTRFATLSALGSTDPARAVELLLLDR